MTFFVFFVYGISSRTFEIVLVSSYKEGQTFLSQFHVNNFSHLHLNPYYFPSRQTCDDHGSKSATKPAGVLPWSPHPPAPPRAAYEAVLCPSSAHHGSSP